MRGRIRPIPAVSAPAAGSMARRTPRARAIGGALKKARGAGAWLGLVLFMVLMAMFIPPDLADPMGDIKDFGAPSPTLRALKISMLILSAMIVTRRWWQSQALIKQLNPWFIAMMVLVPVSTFWSIDKGATQARFVSLLSMVAVCYVIGLLAWNRRRFQDIVRPTLTLFLLASLVVGIIWPDLVIENGSEDPTLLGSWHGLVGQKNEFGQIGSLGVIMWVHAWLTRESKWYYVVFGLAVAWSCLWLSKSSTSLLATVLAVPILFLLQRPPRGLRPYMPFVVTIFTGLVLVYAIAILNIVPGLGILLKPFVALSGKDFTFSNRVMIWQLIQEHIQKNPMFGTGYGAYWVGPIPGSPSAEFLTRLYVYPTQSHNGFLEITNDLGFFGLFILLGYLIYHVKQCLAIFKFDRIQPPLFLAILFQQIVVNLSEACFITSKNASSLVMTFCTVAVACALSEHQRTLQDAAGRLRATGAKTQAAGGRARAAGGGMKPVGGRVGARGIGRRR